MKKGQAFVRVQLRNGRWVNGDILDLDQKSFNAFVLNMMMRVGIVTSIKEEFVEGEEIKYRLRPELEAQYNKEKDEEND